MATALIPTLPFAERRSHRSRRVIEAIELQLDYARREFGLRHFTLGGPSGLVIARAGIGPEHSALAAWAPLVERCADRERRRALRCQMRHNAGIEHGDDFATRAFDVHGERLYLTAVGPSGSVLATSSYRVITGVRRILERG